jgi:hypothetical protein
MYNVLLPDFWLFYKAVQNIGITQNKIIAKTYKFQNKIKCIKI